MSYLNLNKNETLFRNLYTIDENFSEKCRAKGCQKPGCGGPLHKAYYCRKPRGENCIIPEEYSFRLGLCCGWCRRRTLPPSCLFFGRRVFWGIILLLITSIILGLQKCTITELSHRFGVSFQTIGRWRLFFKQDFPNTKQWQNLRGRVNADVTNDTLPRSLLESFLSKHEPIEAVQQCLCFWSSG